MCGVFPVYQDPKKITWLELSNHDCKLKPRKKKKRKKRHHLLLREHFFKKNGPIILSSWS